MPRQNRPIIRDGRLQQQKKKRTDRSYLRPEAAPPPRAADEPVEAADESEAETSQDGLGAAASATDTRPAVRPTPAATVAPPPAQRGAGRMPTAVRAIQQQGVRKRRELDLHALGVADTQYAMHELRRIAVLAGLVIVTLIVLGIVLR